jgi:hypothetical protein
LIDRVRLVAARAKRITCADGPLGAAIPNAEIVPIVSTGGAARTLAQRLPLIDRDLTDDFDFVSLLLRCNKPLRESRA